MMTTNRMLIEWADRTLAHVYPLEPQDPVPTFDDLITLVTDVIFRYVRLLGGVDLDPSGVELEAGWKRVLAVLCSMLYQS